MENMFTIATFVTKIFQTTAMHCECIKKITMTQRNPVLFVGKCFLYDIIICGDILGTINIETVVNISGVINYLMTKQFVTIKQRLKAA